MVGIKLRTVRKEFHLGALKVKDGSSCNIDFFFGLKHGGSFVFGFSAWALFPTLRAAQALEWWRFPDPTFAPQGAIVRERTRQVKK